MTPWGEKVTVENAWTEYPRPNFVRERWLSLNGLWDYAVRPRTDAAPQRYDGRILVPFCVESTLSGVGKPVTPGDRLWYRRAFTVPAAWKGERVLLHFEAVDYEATVWLNGALVGSHAGGSTAFSFDLTDYLRDGANELALSVWDPTSAGEQPRGKQILDPRGIWYTPVSGIWQTVWLEPVPRERRLAELRVTPDLDQKKIVVDALVDAAVEDDSLGVRLTASAEGKVVASTIVRINRTAQLGIAEPRVWSPETPFLYDLKAELVRVKPAEPFAPVKGKRPPLKRFGATERQAYARAEVTGAPLDVVRSYFAMRKISIGAGPVAGQPAILLNGKAVFQHGTLDQGWWPDGLLTPPSDAAMIWELEYLRNAGFNMLRKHIKVEPRRYYYHCDRLGVLIWQDMPSGFNQALRTQRADEGEAVRLSTSREQHELELRRMLGQLHNHPSIVTWVVHNEGWGQYETAALTSWVKSVDASRLVIGSTGWLDRGGGDLASKHTYEEVPLPADPDPRRAIVLGEYGGVGWPLTGHLWNPEMRNWGYQTYQSKETFLAAFRKKIEAVIAMKDRGLSAAVYTQTSDVEGEVNGLVTYDRKVVKVEPAYMAELNRKLIEGR
ncbi:MAG: glycoside hydrolase family 2 [Verrucomicrobia bacterium]|nr:glycoside hydrolase family 2 [Verrucomicrobiota bacterium]